MLMQLALKQPVPLTVPVIRVSLEMEHFVKVKKIFCMLLYSAREYMYCGIYFAVHTFIFMPCAYCSEAF